MALQFQCAKDAARHWQDPMYSTSEANPFQLKPSLFQRAFPKDKSPKCPIVKGRLADTSSERAERSRVGGWECVAGGKDY